MGRIFCSQGQVDRVLALFKVKKGSWLARLKSDVDNESVLQVNLTLSRRVNQVVYAALIASFITK
jgi:hypothetical protein